ncbi:alpha/beta fold hydrolase [Nitratireductor kimnyeongensis]|uniref:Alpha/beta fold hydrolase n=1 Tax=Nitratireductor kimnyeongensis TaxID=430679 RepID=A0ABW0T729_9HYPH|nr:alpha/beta hydrolase [Nitratireductor kimnyeongensis]QZZ34616.1 alpha/beta hydrolase [Nitratireductor kimnyeongensis]
MNASEGPHMRGQERSDNGRGRRVDIGGYSLNSLRLLADRPDLPPLVFIHGASTSLLDPLYAFRSALEGRAHLLFIDRPGHGLSDRGPGKNILPDAQGGAIARVMEARGIDRAIIIGHSYGGAVAAAMALDHPERVIGTLFLAPALYPWPGGVAWYYNVARTRMLGAAFCRLVVPWAGRLAVKAAARGVFSPDPMPDDYLEATRALEAVAPAAFRHNAREISALLAWTERTYPRYRAIETPSVIITGTKDDIVSPALHSHRLARELPHAELIAVDGLGHKPDVHATDLAVAAIEKLARGTRGQHIGKHLQGGVAKKRPVTD